MKVRRLGALDPDNLEWERSPDKPPNPASLGHATSTRAFDASASSGTTTEELTITRRTTWEFGAELNLEKLGLKAKLGTKVSYEREVVYSNEFPGRHHYVAARYLSFPACLWSVDSA